MKISAEAVVPKTALPAGVIAKSVLPVEEATANGVTPCAGATERVAHGEVVPMPKFPLASRRARSVPPVEKPMTLAAGWKRPVVRSEANVYAGVEAVPVPPMPMNCEPALTVPGTAKFEPSKVSLQSS